MGENLYSLRVEIINNFWFTDVQIARKPQFVITKQETQSGEQEEFGTGELKMADVKWIKITTNIFDDEKIILIESLPDAYAIITVWFKLLCLAGKQNNSGVFMMGKVAYTDKMLATIFRMKESTVTMALQTFEQFGMIEILDGVITIPNWGKHQNLDQLESKREYMRNYMKGYRAKQELLASGEKASDSTNKSNCKTNSKTNSKANVSEADIDIDKDKELDKEYINNNTSASDEADVKKTPKKQKEPKRKHGEYQHVLLTDSEFESLAEFFGEDVRDKAIKFLDEYIEEKGYRSKSHNLAIRRWVVDAVNKEKPKNQQRKSGSFETDDFFNAALSKSYRSGRREPQMSTPSEPPKLVSESEELQARAEALKQRIGADKP